MTPGDYVKSALGTLMWNEPHDDHLLGMTASGLIVRNRMNAGWEGGDWLRLIETYDRYSANPPTTPRVMQLGNPYKDDLFRRVLGIAEAIYDGREKDITFGALWCARLDQCSEDFAAKIVRNSASHQRVATVGLRQFFR